MTPHAHPIVMLAQVDLSKVSEAMVQGPDMPYGLLLMLAGAIAVLLTGMSLHQRFKQGPAEPHPLQVFSRIASQVGVSWTQRLLLIRIAKHANLPSPLSLLLASGTLQHHGRQYAAGIAAARRKRVFKTLAKIQRQCFQSDPTPEAHEPLEARVH